MDILGLIKNPITYMMENFSQYLNPELVFFLNTKTRNETIQELVESGSLKNSIENKKEFINAIIDRETIVSTGIGMGVAIPHAKLPAFDHFFIIIGILKHPVEWNSLDSAPVRIVFLIGGPDDKQTEYLQILSGLTGSIKDEERRKKMLTLKSKEDIISLFQDF